MLNEMFLMAIQNTPSQYAVELNADALQLQTTYYEYYAKIGFNLPWIGYFIVSNAVVVGVCGYKGSPTNNKVEIAYYTFEQYQNNGIANLACKKLIDIAQDYDVAIQIIANTAPEQNYSTKVLQKNNFAFVREYIDAVDGKIWEWEFNKLN